MLKNAVVGGVVSGLIAAAIYVAFAVALGGATVSSALPGAAVIGGITAVVAGGITYVAGSRKAAARVAGGSPKR